MITRKEFQEKYATADLSKREIRQEINNTVVDEILETRHKRQSWDCPGFAPLDTSHKQYLRPVGAVLFGPRGWELRLQAQWFSE